MNTKVKASVLSARICASHRSEDADKYATIVFQVECEGQRLDDLGLHQDTIKKVCLSNGAVSKGTELLSEPYLIKLYGADVTKKKQAEAQFIYQGIKVKSARIKNNTTVQLFFTCSFPMSDSRLLVWAFDNIDKPEVVVELCRMQGNIGDINKKKKG